MKLSADVVAGWVVARATNIDYRPLENVLIDVLTAEFETNSKREFSDEEISDIAEAHMFAVSDALGAIREELIRDGVTPSFEIDFGEPQRFFRVKETPEKVLLDKLVSMNPTGFELFCKRILERMKANAVVQGGPHDGGVDFFALGLNLGGDLGPIPPAAKSAVVGQAKRWKTTREVSETDLRTFIGGAVAQADELRKQHADRFGLFTPVSFAFWATCGFSSSARRYARSMGLWYLNGVSLAQLALRLGLSEIDVVQCDVLVNGGEKPLPAASLTNAESHPSSPTSAEAAMPTQASSPSGSSGNESKP